MDKKDQWEYDYSNIYNMKQPTGEKAPYENVGSSGTNRANRASASTIFDDLFTPPGAQRDAQQPESAAPYSEQASRDPFDPITASAPRYHSTFAPENEDAYKKVTPKKHPLRTVVSLILVFAVGFSGGYVGSKFGASGNGTVVVQQVQRDTDDVTSLSTSTNGVDLTTTQVSALVSPSVVVITTEQMVASYGWYGGGTVESGAGSGVIISADGYILTCQHVIQDASNVIVTIDDVDYVAQVIGGDVQSDIAVIKIDAKGLTPAVLGDSDILAVGENVLAVGNPLGELGGTVTNGIVSALNRNLYVEENEMTLIQTNASVSPGNSGGGLFNMAGELVGIVNAKSNDSDAEGLGFAIPVNTAYDIAQNLIENGYVTGRPELGITALTINDADTAAMYGVSAYGIYIYELNEGSAAQKAGLQPGDRIISIANVEVATLEDLTGTLADCTVGDTVKMTIARKGQVMSVDVTLGEKGSTTAAPAPQLPTEQAPNEQAAPEEEQGSDDSFWFNPFR